MRAVFADPKTDFVFKRIFGNEAHKDLLIALLDALLELDEPHRITGLEFLTPEQRMPIDEFKLSIVDVKCKDASGRTYVVEMQVLNVEGFEKRVVYNSAKAYVAQLRTGSGYPALADVIGVSICNFEVWPNPPVSETVPVPMLSRWRMQEQHGGALGLSQIQHVFLELPKYTAGDSPSSLIDKWAYFFREAENLEIIPSALAGGPFREALEVARIAGFDAFELDHYDKAKMAEQDARGALSLALREGEERGEIRGEIRGIAKGREKGRQEGLEEGIELGLARGLRSAIQTACTLLAIPIGAEQERQLAEFGPAELEALRDRLLQDRRWP